VRTQVAHADPWTTEALYALPEDGMRHELLDGTLLVSPPPSVPHQLAARRLVAALGAAAPPDIEVLEAVGVAVPAGLLVPDVVVAWAAAVHGAQRNLAAADVLAVVEIVSTSSRTQDRRWKPEAYAEAGIGVFVRVELTDTADGEPEITVSELIDGGYLAVTVARGAQPTELRLPFPVIVWRTRALARRRPGAVRRWRLGRAPRAHTVGRGPGGAFGGPGSAAASRALSEPPFAVPLFGGVGSAAEHPLASLS